MNTIARIQHKGQVTIPTRLRNQAGLAKGDLVEFSLQRGKIVITPKLMIDRSQFPSADYKYTPAQRKIIDARLDLALEEVRKGHVSPAFATAAEFAAALKAEAKKRNGREGAAPSEAGTRGLAAPERVRFARVPQERKGKAKPSARR
ncbi:MAG: AbrB/MazE/SpoVT family DNA-binding domain-containing protein [Bryobacterales bacterium]|nr:AbrB/MazE/SpoVT family DNA-binding domain-containing protein [Bryobacterales bacterium]